MNFSGRSVYIGPRVAATTASWPAWAMTVQDEGVREEPLPPVSSYAEAEGLVRSTGAERLFVPADVLADIVREGAGPA